MKIISGFFFYAFIFAFILGNLYKPQLMSVEAHIGLLDITVILAAIYVLVFRFSKLRSEIGLHSRISRSLLIFFSICLFTLLLSLFRFHVNQVIVGGMYLVRIITYSSLIFTLPIIFSSAQLSNFKFPIICAVFLTGAFQYVFIPDVRFLQVSEWDPHYFRVVGTLLDPGFLSIILCFFLFQIWMHPISSDRRTNLGLWFAIYILFALTYSRSGYLAFLAGWAYLAFVGRSVKKIVYPVILVILTLVLLPRGPGGEGVKLERTSSIQARIINWKNSLTIFVDNPITGVGFNTYRYAQKEYGFLDQDGWLRSHAGAGADSSLLFVAATTGIFGLVSYLWIMKEFWREAGQKLYLKAGLTALAIHSIFLNSLFYPFVLFWILLSLTEKNLKAYK